MIVGATRMEYSIFEILGTFDISWFMVSCMYCKYLMESIIDRTVCGNRHWLKLHPQSIGGSAICLSNRSVQCSLVHMIWEQKNHQDAPVNIMTLDTMLQLIWMDPRELATCGTIHFQLFQFDHNIQMWCKPHKVIDPSVVRHCVGGWWLHNVVWYNHKAWVMSAGSIKHFID